MLEEFSINYYNSGLKYIKEKNFEIAIEHLLKSIAFNKTNIYSWNLLGLCFLKQGKIKMAEYCWKQSISNNCKDNVAFLYLEKLNNKIENVENSFRNVLKICKNKKYKKAIKIFEKEILSILSNTISVQNLYGVLKFLNKDKTGSRKIWVNALKEDISNIEVINYLSCLNEARKNKYIEYLKKIFTLCGEKE